MNQQEAIKKLYALDPATPINVVLSGGGQKGVAHIALLEKIEELGLTINAMSCCSSGSIVGAMYASGRRPHEIFEFFKKTDLFRYQWITFAKPGIFDTIRYKRIVKKQIADSFEKLDIPIHICTTNMNHAKVRYFSEGDLLLPLLASCALPGLFNPIIIENELYNDGGILDNFPISPFYNSKYPVIGSNIATMNHKTSDELDTTMKLAIHTVKMMADARERYKYSKIDLTISFPLDDYSVLDNKDINKIYETAKQHLNA